MRESTEQLIGEASSFLEVIEKVSQLALLNKPILVVGERGTGKELIASRLHYLSDRWEQPFITLNCAAINENLLETELFGHEAGSFTGASKRSLGRFELAHQGTLFLDEIGNSSTAVQEKLLRVIEYGEFERVGGNKTISVDVRVIAATNEHLPLLASQNKFRADLLDRLAFDVVTLPPLRERVSDIQILSQHFALAMTKELGRSYFAGFTRDAQKLLNGYPWPGNVRELKNVVERNIYRSLPDRPIDQIQFDPFESPYQPHGLMVNGLKNNNSGPADVNSTSSTDSNQESNLEADEQTEVIQDSKLNVTNSQFTAKFPLDFKQSMIDTEINLLKQALKHSHFNQKKCALLLGLTYHQLRGYLKKYQLLEQK